MLPTRFMKHLGVHLRESLHFRGKWIVSRLKSSPWPLLVLNRLVDAPLLIEMSPNLLPSRSLTGRP